jgi:hypothetical protein
MIYIVLGPGRTGSILICEILGSLCNALRASTDDMECTTSILARKNSVNIVLHSHSKLIIDKVIIEKLKLDPKEITLILSKRRDLFLQIMSNFVAEITGETHSYTKKSPTPIFVDPMDFVSRYASEKKWYDSIDQSLCYRKIVEIYYEDFTKPKLDPSVIANALGIENTSNEYLEPNLPSPYSFKDWIVNWENLYQIYQVNMYADSVYSSTVIQQWAAKFSGRGFGQLSRT